MFWSPSYPPNRIFPLDNHSQSDKYEREWKELSVPKRSPGRLVGRIDGTGVSRNDVVCLCVYVFGLDTWSMLHVWSRA
jgi:hypothetical protein